MIQNLNYLLLQFIYFYSQHNDPNKLSYKRVFNKRLCILSYTFDDFA